MKAEILAVLEESAIVSPREHPKLASSIRYQAEKGGLTRILGDHYSTPDAALTFEARVAAARAVHPNGVFVRETAARLSWLEELDVQTVQMAAPRRHPVKGFSFERRTIPEELRVWDGEHFLTDPALTVLDLTDTVGSAAISDALRRGVTTMERLEEA